MIDVKKVPGHLHQACKYCISKNCVPADVRSGEKLLYSAGDFVIPCNGIPADWSAFLQDALGEEKWETLSPEDRKNLVDIYDVTGWATNNLTSGGGPWVPRGATLENIKRHHLDPETAYYQWLMLNCTAKRKTYRVGRRCGKSEAIAVSILHSLLTNDEYRILVVCPFKSQVELIFNRIKELCATSTRFQSSIAREVMTPYPTIKLWNKSSVIGFTSGSRSGANANTLRGQGAKKIVLDEADYLNPNDLASIMGLLAEGPHIEIWASSTPTGKRERFYQINQMPEYRKFHYPSMCNPQWADSMEQELRGFFTDLEYVHEVLADWGTEAAGVFQKPYLDRALDSYLYSDLNPTRGWVYSMGIDWNPVAGTQIVVVGAYHDPEGENPGLRFKVVDAGEVQIAGWTELKALAEIIRLNRKWNPFSIYLDKGGGGSLAVQLLHNVGAEGIRNSPGSPDAFLLKIVKGIDFGSHLETWDPWTKEKVDRPMKVFMVNNAVRQFENNRIHLSRFDKQLYEQLEGYVVDHISPNGIPVYKAREEKVADHRLDALMLALLSFTMEKTEIGKINYSSNIAFVTRGSLFDDIPESQRAGMLEMQRQAEQAKVKSRAHAPAIDRTKQITVKSYGMQGKTPIANGQLKSMQTVDWDPRKYYDSVTKIENNDERQKKFSVLLGGKRKPSRRSNI